MCGIIGSLTIGELSNDLNVIKIGHRGPDGCGEWVSEDGYCWLGHTRLAIQDVSSAGQQPMISHDGRYVLIFNGEIYNHQSLRSELRFQNWRGHSDTETLIEGLAEQGPTFLLRLRGMFAFACYDQQERLLILGRDRLGIKPLYVQQRNGDLYFASERQALGPMNLSPQELSQALSFGHLSTPSEIANLRPNEVYSLPPGTVARIHQEDSSWQPIRYWPSQPQPDWGPLSIQSQTQAHCLVRQELERVVSEHLLADVPVACFLSGGLDSGILTALATRLNPSRIASFTVVFPGQPQDEQQRAQRMAQHCGTEHHELSLADDQILDWLEAGISQLDIPSADGLNTYLVSRAVASQGIKVALSGLGGDELFGGYATHPRTKRLGLLKRLPTSLRQHLVKRLPTAYRQKLNSLPKWDEWHLSLACRRWYGDEDLLAAGLPTLTWPQAPAHRISQSFGRITWGELFGYTEPMLLRDSDVMSMACGLELRVPFLDHQLVELALRMPQEYQGYGKTLLKQSCQDLFPPNHLEQSKQGFELPMQRWMTGPLRECCQERLQALNDSQQIDSTWLNQQWHQFEQGYLHWTRAWTLVVLGELIARPIRKPLPQPEAIVA